MKKVWILMLFFFAFPFSTSAFVLGLKSTDNTVENVVKIEKDYSLYLPLIGFIYDPRDKQDVVTELEKRAGKPKNLSHLAFSKPIFCWGGSQRSLWRAIHTIFQDNQEIKFESNLQDDAWNEWRLVSTRLKPHKIQRSLDTCMEFSTFARFESAGYPVWLLSESPRYANPLNPFPTGKTPSLQG